MELPKSERFDDIINKLTEFYPKIVEPKIALAATGISPRIYSHWRAMGLLDESKNKKENQKWVKLNLYDYIWLNLVKTLRGFGFPLNEIAKLREELFSNALDVLKSFDDEIIEEIKKIIKEKKPDCIDVEFLNYAIENRNNVPEEYKILQKQFVGLVNRVVVLNDDVSLLILKTNDGFKCTMYSSQSMKDFGENINEWLSQPHIHLPLKPLVFDFLDEPKNEANLLYWGFINEDEQKVIEAIRKKEFKELIIRFNGPNKEEMILEGIYDGDILEQKAKEIKRILGLNQYSEVTIKYRNDKHLYFKNKLRL